MSFWLDPVNVRRLVCLLACIGIALSSLEWLIPTSKIKFTGFLCSGYHGATLAERLWRPFGIQFLFALRLACAVAFVASIALASHLPEAGLAVFAAGVLSLPLRFRSPIGVLFGMDGAEHLMTSTLLVMGATFLSKTNMALEAALVFIAAQGVLEYASAGWTKLRDWKGWATGLYLTQVFASSNYGHPRVAQFLQSNPTICGILSISVIAVEVAVPCSLVLPWPIAEVLLLIALTFHIVTAVTMGLNTFVWAFAATYPAILHCRDILLNFSSST
jgi:hypothetical protein